MDVVNLRQQQIKYREVLSVTTPDRSMPKSIDKPGTPRFGSSLPHEVTANHEIKSSQQESPTLKISRVLALSYDHQENHSSNDQSMTSSQQQTTELTLPILSSVSMTSEQEGLEVPSAADCGSDRIERCPPDPIWGYHPPVSPLDDLQCLETISVVMSTDESSPKIKSGRIVESVHDVKSGQDVKSVQHVKSVYSVQITGQLEHVGSKQEEQNECEDDDDMGVALGPNSTTIGGLVFSNPVEEPTKLSYSEMHGGTDVEAASSSQSEATVGPASSSTSTFTEICKIKKKKVRVDPRQNLKEKQLRLKVGVRVGNHSSECSSGIYYRVEI